MGGGEALLLGTRLASLAGERSANAPGVGILTTYRTVDATETDNDELLVRKTKQNIFLLVPVLGKGIITIKLVKKPSVKKLEKKNGK